MTSPTLEKYHEVILTDRAYKFVTSCIGVGMILGLDTLDPSFVESDPSAKASFNALVDHIAEEMNKDKEAEGKLLTEVMGKFIHQ